MSVVGLEAMLRWFRWFCTSMGALSFACQQGDMPHTTPIRQRHQRRQPSAPPGVTDIFQCLGVRSPPVVIRVNGANASEVSTTSKLTLSGIYTSTDPRTTLRWSALGYEDPSFSLLYGEAQRCLVCRASLHGATWSPMVRPPPSFSHLAP